MSLSRQTSSSGKQRQHAAAPVNTSAVLAAAGSGNNQYLASLFECPVCFDYALPPIMQCQSGHIVCQSCRQDLNLCPACRGPLGNIRNLPMEKVAIIVMFPCKYSYRGCPVTLLHTDKTDHEDICKYRAEKCPNIGTRLWITKKANENANKKVSNRTSENTGISKTDVKDKRVQKKHAVEEKTSKNQQGVAHACSQQNSLSKEIQDLEMKMQEIQDRHVKILKLKELASLKLLSLGGTDALDNKLEYIARKARFIYSSKLIVDVGCKAYDAVLFDEFEKNILNVGNDEITKQLSGIKEKIEWLNRKITEKKRLASQSLKEVVQRENYFQKENQLTEQEKTELVDQLKELHILKERESDLQKEDELKEQVKEELPANNIVFHRTKIRNAKSKMNTSSLYCAYNLYRKNVLERVLVSLEQLVEALDGVQSPHYIWPFEHPLILSKVRQIKLDFSSSEQMERLHSFVNGINRRHRTWDSDQIVRPEPMVSAGFSYDGEDDKVVCKSCGAISDVNDWSDNDEDYAFTMHRRTGSSHCEFLRKFDRRRSTM